LALKIYFHIQNYFATEVKKLKDVSTILPASLFILVYPHSESFEQCFNSNEKMMVVNWDSDLVLGINENPEGIDFEFFNIYFRSAYAQWFELNKKQKHEEISL
jgi:hypothetical protein